MQLRPLLLTAALIGSFSGCKRGDEDGSGSPRADLQIVSRGSEPRRSLRYQVPKGTTQKLDLAVDMKISAGDMGGALPTIVMSLTIVVEDVVPVGMKLRTTVVDAAARDRDESRVAPEALTGALDMLRGVELTSTLTPNGRVFATKLDTGAKEINASAKSQLAALTSSVDGLMMPLPDDPVGVGAVWRSSRPIEQNEMKLTAVSTIEVTALEGDKLVFAIDTAIHGDDQRVEQSGMTVEIKDVIGTGTGTGTIDLRTLAVTSELSTELRSEMQATGETATTPMRMSVMSKVSPRSAAPAPLPAN